MTDQNAVHEIALNELTPIKVYLDVISTSQDPDEVRAASDLYSSLFNVDPPGTKSSEDFTERVSHKLSQVNGEEPVVSPLQGLVYQVEDILGGKKVKSYSPEEQLLSARIGAVTHLVRSMIQGNQNFPVERYSEVIDMCTETLAGLDSSITPRKAKRFIRREIREIWDPYIRSAEALKLVGAPTRSTVYRIGHGVMSLLASDQKTVEMNQS